MNHMRKDKGFESFDRQGSLMVRIMSKGTSTAVHKLTET